MAGQLLICVAVIVSIILIYHSYLEEELAGVVLTQVDRLYPYRRRNSWLDGNHWLVPGSHDSLCGYFSSLCHTMYKKQHFTTTKIVSGLKEFICVMQQHEAVWWAAQLLRFHIFVSMSSDL